jgi:6 kDa early secretory antigenic target
MADEITYSFPQLNAAADSCKTAVSTMMSRIEDFESTCNALKATWDGEAQSVYTIREKEWSSAADDLKILLEGIERALRQSATEMQASEQRNQRALGG